MFPGIWGWRGREGGGVASFNLLLCIKYQLMWQPMDGLHQQPGIPHHWGMWALLWLVQYGLILYRGMMQFGLVCELCTSCAAHQRPRQCGHNLSATHQNLTQVTLVFETLMSAGHNFILHLCCFCNWIQSTFGLPCFLLIHQQVNCSVTDKLNLKRLTLEPAS